MSEQPEESATAQEHLEASRESSAQAREEWERSGADDAGHPGLATGPGVEAPEEDGAG